VPFAAGGDTTASNLELRCRAHNAYEAKLHSEPLIVRETAARYSVQTELVDSLVGGDMSLFGMSGFAAWQAVVNARQACSRKHARQDGL
jgi:hypothetical protein